MTIAEKMTQTNLPFRSLWDFVGSSCISLYRKMLLSHIPWWCITIFVKTRHLARVISGASPVYSVPRSILAMSTDSLVTSLPSRAWSCETLNEGIVACANLAGLQLKPQDIAQASQWAGSGSMISLYSFHIYGCMKTCMVMGNLIECGMRSLAVCHILPPHAL